MTGSGRGGGWAAVLGTVVAVLALIGFTAMHGIAVTDAASARHVVPSLSTADATPATTAGAHATAHAGAHPAPTDTPSRPSPSPGEHTHDGALLGCLIALTGLALLALAKRPSTSLLHSWPRPVAVLLDGWAPATPGLPPGYAQLRLGVLRI